MTPECQQLLEALECATSRLADPGARDAAEVQEGFEKRGRAIEDIAAWIAAEREASRPISPELGNHLIRNLDAGNEILVRMAIEREATRLDLARLGREQQMLRGLNNSSITKPNTIDYQG